MKAKAKIALECETKSCIYAQRKIDVESVFGHIKGNRLFCRFLLRGIKKVHISLDLWHWLDSLLKVVGIRQLLSDTMNQKIKIGREKRLIFLYLFLFF